MHPRGNQEMYQTSGMSFYLYLPTGDAPPNGWPALLFLHGVGEAPWNFLRDRSEWIYQPLSVIKLHGSPPALCEARNSTVQDLLSSFIVASPQYPYFPDDHDRLNGRRNWQWVNQVDAIAQIVDIVIAEFGGDQQRIYATGFSRGGQGALEIFQRLHGCFAKLVLVDSESIPGNLPDIPLWVHYGGQGTLPNIVTAHQPLVGRLDRGALVEVAPNQRVPDGIEHPFTTWNENHPGTCRRAYSDHWIYDWLLRLEG
jgi:predicted peptidase